MSATALKAKVAAINKIKYKTIDEVAHVLDAEFESEMSRSGGFRRPLSVEEMRKQVADLAAKNLLYIDNGYKASEAMGAAFQKKPELLYREKDGAFQVGLRFRKRWVELKKGKYALAGVPRKKLFGAIAALAGLANRGGLDEQIAAVYDATKQKRSTKARKSAESN